MWSRCWPLMQRCLTWLSEQGCRPDGFVSYIDESGQGLANQGWKDSWDAVQFRDGRIASAPLALCEVQGYAYEAAMAGAELLDAFGLGPGPAGASSLSAWRSGFAPGSGSKTATGPTPPSPWTTTAPPSTRSRPTSGTCSVPGCSPTPRATSWPGASSVPELNSGFGLRTLATSSAGFNPLSYHCGSVWLASTAIAIAGLARTPGSTARKALVALADGLLCAAEGFRYRLPELYGGHARGEGLLSPPVPRLLSPSSLGGRLIHRCAGRPPGHQARRPGRHRGAVSGSDGDGPSAGERPQDRG